MDTKQCPKCGAKWIGGQHYWATGKEGDPHDLAGLVCNKLGDDTCINPCRGSTSGVTWEDRLKGMNSLEKDLNKVNENI
jgi:hypothetical protein